MLKLKEAVIVEGKFDKIRLSSVVESVIIEVGGFQIFKDEQTLAMLRGLAERQGIIVLTDSDSAGFLIRGYLSGAIPSGRVLHAYIPDVFGKERRKAHPSAEGKLGVEGIDCEILRDALLRAGAALSERQGDARLITTADLYEDGLTGKAYSKQYRNAFKKLLGLPERMALPSFLKLLNATMTYEQYRSMVDALAAESKTE